MHTKVVFQAAKALTRIGCVVLRFNFRGVGRSAGTWDDGRGEMDDFRAAVDFLSREVSRSGAVGSGVFLRLVHCNDRRCGRRSGLRVDRHRAAGESLRVRVGEAVDEAEVHRARRKRRADPSEGRARVLRPARRTRRSSSRSIAPITCSTDRRAKWATRSKTCWRISHAGRSNRFGDTNGGRQGAERRPPNRAPRRDGRGRDRRGAAPRARRRALRHRRRDPRLRDAGGRAGAERRAHREPARRRAGRCIGGHGESVLRLRVCRRSPPPPSTSCAASRTSSSPAAPSR